MMKKEIKCGCVVEIGTHWNIIFCPLHRGNVNQELFRLAQKVAMWDGDSSTYLDILRTSFPIVKRILEDPTMRTLL